MSLQPCYEHLERLVEEAKKRQVEAKLRAKTGAVSANGTPNSNSRASEPLIVLFLKWRNVEILYGM